MNSINSIVNSISNIANQNSTNNTLKDLIQNVNGNEINTLEIENQGNEEAISSISLQQTNSSFKDIISDQINKLNNKQLESDKMIQDLISGEAQDIHSVMIAAEEAKIALELAVQVRNKCIEAYKEINNVQL